MWWMFLLMSLVFVAGMVAASCLWIALFSMAAAREALSPEETRLNELREEQSA